MIVIKSSRASFQNTRLKEHEKAVFSMFDPGQTLQPK